MIWLLLKFQSNCQNPIKKKKPGSDIKIAVNTNPKYKNSIQWIGDKLRMEADLTKTLFNDSCKK